MLTAGWYINVAEISFVLQSCIGLLELPLQMKYTQKYVFYSFNLVHLKSIFYCRYGYVNIVDYVPSW